MGARGPKRTPTAILQVRGSWLAKTRAGEVRVDHGRPKCPPWLQGEAKRVWRELSKKLHDTGLLSTVDGRALARYCSYWVLWLKELSNPMRSDATLDRYANQLNRLEKSFGLTPADRAGLNAGGATHGKNGEDKERFFRIG